LNLDACHMLTCAIMLLNTDLHDPVSREDLFRLIVDVYLLRIIKN